LSILLDEKPTVVPVRLAGAHRQWVEIALRDELAVRDARWSEAVAVGSLAFVEKVKTQLGFKAAHPELISRFER
jgi:hypothetical protein